MSSFLFGLQRVDCSGISSRHQVTKCKLKTKASVAFHFGRVSYNFGIFIRSDLHMLLQHQPLIITRCMRLPQIFFGTSALPSENCGLFSKDLAMVCPNVFRYARLCSFSILPMQLIFFYSVLEWHIYVSNVELYTLTWDFVDAVLRIILRTSFQKGFPARCCKSKKVTTIQLSGRLVHKRMYGCPVSLDPFLG